MDVVQTNSTTTPPPTAPNSTFVVEFDPYSRIENTIVDCIVCGRATNPDEVGIVESGIDIRHPDVSKLGFKIVDVSLDEILKVLFLCIAHL